MKKNQKIFFKIIISAEAICDDLLVQDLLLSLLRLDCFC